MFYFFILHCIMLSNLKVGPNQPFSFIYFLSKFFEIVIFKGNMLLCKELTLIHITWTF